MANELSDSRLIAFLSALKIRMPGDAPPLPDLASVRQIDRDTDLAELFAQQATRAGMGVRSCVRVELAAVLAEELGRVAVYSAVFAIEGSTQIATAIPAVVDSLTAAGVRILEQNGDDVWFSAGAGITTVECAIAETGSLLVASAAATPRSASLIPPVHVALVAASRIVPDLVDAFALVSTHDLPACVTLISGPSKTADIEGVLVTGVHGPGQVLVILVTDA